MKKFANGNCEECEMQNKCPAVRLGGFCPEIHIIRQSQWEMGLKDCDYLRG